jgi:hypothetical protein
MLLDINIRYQDIIFIKRLNNTQRQTLGQNIKKKTIINANKHTKLNKSNMDSMKNKSVNSGFLKREAVPNCISVECIFKYEEHKIYHNIDNQD